MRWLPGQGFESAADRERFRTDMCELARRVTPEAANLPLVFASDLECRGADASTLVGVCISGESIFLNDAAVIASGCIDGYRRLEAIYLHEIAHTLEPWAIQQRAIARKYQSPPPPITTARLAPRMAAAFNKAIQRESHPYAFWRGLGHIFWRVRRLGLWVFPELLATPGVYGLGFEMHALVNALYAEAKTMANETFVAIHETKPIPEFEKLFILPSAARAVTVE